ncbi:MAG: Spy/CpxP family protein refolding chaperone [Luteitalea sp.]
MYRLSTRMSDMGYTTRLAAVALAATLGLATVAHAQPGPSPGGPGGGDGFGGRGGRGGALGGLLALHPDLPLPALNLSDAQREQVRTVMESHRDEGRAIGEKAHAALEALRKATAASPDEGAVAQQSQALGAVIGEAALLRARVRSEIAAILTPEQLAEATTLHSQRKPRTQQRREQMQQRRQSRRQ